MHDAVVTDRKKKLVIGAGVAALIVIAIITGAYATQQAGAQQPSGNVFVPGDTDMSIDLNVDGLIIEPDAITDIVAPDNDASIPQQSEPSTTNSNVEVRVNGNSVEVPENGSVYKQITTEDGSTSINFRAYSNTTSGESMDRSSVNVDVDSSVEMRKSGNE